MIAVNSENLHHNSIVAFIDILGFKELIKSPSLQEDILNFLSYIKNENSLFEYNLKKEDSLVQGNIKFDISSSSDHIILSVPILLDKYPDKNESSLIFWLLLEITECISRIHIAGIQFGFVLRGAISMGKHYSDVKNQITFGTALVEAIESESNLASYPRVILAKSLLKYIHEVKNTFESEYYNERYIDKIARDFDGLLYVDYLHWAFCLLSTQNLELIKLKIENGIKENLKGTLNVLTKWRWLANYYNAKLEAWQLKESSHKDLKNISLVIGK